MIKPENMTLLQNMYALCHLGVTLSAKQKNKDTMDLFSKFGSMMPAVPYPVIAKLKSSARYDNA